MALDLGRLLRVQAMVTEAAQTEATSKAGVALVRAYMSLRAEVMLIAQGEGLDELREECNRLFPILDYPSPFNVSFPQETLTVSKLLLVRLFSTYAR